MARRSTTRGSPAGASSWPPTVCRECRSGAGIERVAQSVADEVDGEHREEDRRSGKQCPMRGDVEIVLRVEQDAPPGGNVGREAEAEKRQRRFGNDRGGNIDRSGDDYRPERIRQDVPY